MTSLWMHQGMGSTARGVPTELRSMLLCHSLAERSTTQNRMWGGAGAKPSARSGSSPQGDSAPFLPRPGATVYWKSQWLASLGKLRQGSFSELLLTLKMGTLQAIAALQLCIPSQPSLTPSLQGSWVTRFVSHQVELVQAQSVDAHPLSDHGLPERPHEQVLWRERAHM